MNRDDWTGLGISIGIHALLLLIFGLVASTAEPEPLGLIEVELGPFEMAQPAAYSPNSQPAPTQPEPEPQPVPPAPEPVPTPPVPVDLPKEEQTPEPERIPPPKPVETAPQPQVQTQPERPVASPAPTETTGGAPTGTTGANPNTGDTGASTARRAPYSIDGLNRDPQVSPLPTNPGARGDVAMNICIGPDGRVTRQWPAQRSGTPELDRSAQQALGRWRFNALPPAAPQEEQCGQITFFFRLN